MKKILYITNDQDVQVKVLSQNNLNHFNLIGARFDKIIMDKDISLNDEEWIQVRCCTPIPFSNKEYKKWILKI